MSVPRSDKGEVGYFIRLTTMRYGLEITDAWLDGLGSAWKRAAVFLGWIVFASLVGQSLSGRSPSLEPILQFGGLTYALFGPVCIFSTIAAAVLWIRFVHLENTRTSDFLVFGIMVAINAASSISDLSGTVVAMMNLFVLLLWVAGLLRPRQSS